MKNSATSNLLEINACLCFTLSFFFNILLIWLIWKKTTKEMKSYSFILLQICVIDLWLATVNVFVQPAVYYIAMSSNAVQFIYRYLVLCRDTPVSATKYFCMLGVAGWLTSILAASFGLQCFLDSKNIYIWSAIIKQKTNIDGSHLTCMEKSDSLMHFLNAIFITLFTAICYAIILVCGFKIRNLVKQHKNSKKAENDIQMTLTLILQVL
uniref:G-protein coupled receptors family 1 profile domain-containing protein n=1 Tax=Ditylenchus dipsaci TaxID=166011 RepID=A0A915D0S4_9BILA